MNNQIMNETITRLRSLCFNVGLQLNEIVKSEIVGEFFSISVKPSLRSIATTAVGKKKLNEN